MTFNHNLSRPTKLAAAAENKPQENATSEQKGAVHKQVNGQDKDIEKSQELLQDFAKVNNSFRKPDDKAAIKLKAMEKPSSAKVCQCI